MSTTAVWINAGSYALGRYEKHVLRHELGRPTGKAKVALLLRAVQSVYPDAERNYYAGGVLRFKWNGGEGSGEAANLPTTPGPAVFA